MTVWWTDIWMDRQTCCNSIVLSIVLLCWCVKKINEIWLIAQFWETTSFLWEIKFYYVIRGFQLGGFPLRGNFGVWGENWDHILADSSRFSSCNSNHWLSRMRYQHCTVLRPNPIINSAQERQSKWHTWVTINKTFHCVVSCVLGMRLLSQTVLEREDDTVI